MILSRPIEREIRRTARARLRRSRQLWGDYRRIRRSRLRRAVGSFGMAYFWLLLVIVPFQKDPTHLPILVLSLYCTATVFGRFSSLHSELYGSGDLAFFMHVPVSDQWFWSYAWRKFLRSSIVVWALSFAIFGVRVFQSDLGGVGWLGAAAAATLEWLLVVGFVVVIALAIPKWRVMKVGLPIYGLAVASVFLPAAWVAQLEAAVQTLPTAWIPFFFNRALAGDVSQGWYLLVPILAFLFCLPLAVRRFNRAYPTEEIVYPAASTGASADEDELSSESTTAGDSLRDVAPTLARGPFSLQPVTLPRFAWNESGFIERWTGRWLNVRERSLAEFLCGGELGSWTVHWRLALKIAGIGVVAIFIPSPFPSWIGLSGNGDRMFHRSAIVWRYVGRLAGQADWTCGDCDLCSYADFLFRDLPRPSQGEPDSLRSLDTCISFARRYRFAGGEVFVGWWSLGGG